MFYCVVCDKEVRGKSIESHVESFHPHICSICEVGVVDTIEMESHIESFHAGVHTEGF